MPITPWRWDQGRLRYFEFAAVQRMAAALRPLNGVLLEGGDPLRAVLPAATGLPFLPADYSVWRNYGRVIETALLAVNDHGHLRTSEICAALADRSLGRSQYVELVLRRLYMPWPAFANWTPTASRVYPAAALVKLLVARRGDRTSSAVSLNEVASLLIGNGMTGLEPTDSYLGLAGSGHAFQGDEGRQVREFVAFVGQLPGLTATGTAIQLTPVQGDDAATLERLMTPEVQPPQTERVEELVRLGRMPTGDMAHVAPQVAPETEYRIPTEEVGLATADHQDGFQTEIVLGTYVPADETVTATPPATYVANLDAIDRGLKAHAKTQNDMSAAFVARGFEVARVEQGPAADLILRYNGRHYVVEVKSLTGANETQQVRLGLGQVLDYAHTMRRQFDDVVPILALERQPADERWAGICSSVGVRLTWGPTFDIGE